MRAIDRVRQFITAKRSAYEALLAIVCKIGDEVQNELGIGVVIDVYSRADKQAGDKLKEISKILDAARGKVDFADLSKINDIIGMTIVVQYPDQIPVALDRMKEKLQANKIKQIERKEHRGAYFATHAIFASEAGQHQGLRCEVQCKTLLHNAWSTKMHDLTYKPQGSMDVRLRSLVEAISSTLEGLEQQSQTVRDIIVARHNVERRPFQASLKVLHLRWRKLLSKEWEAKGALVGLEDLWAEIDAAEAQMKKPGTEDPDLDALGARIREAVQDKNLRVCWAMAVKLVGLKIARERLPLMLDLAQMLLDRMPRLLKGGMLTELEVRAVPLGFYVVQEFDQAIDHVERLLNATDTLGLSDECLNKLGFNKATWLLERESMRHSRPWVATAVRKEVNSLIRTYRRKREMRETPQFTDTDGLRLIVFGRRKEDVRRGIEKCACSVQLTDDEDEAQVAAAYADWRAHVGWRRYFELAENAP